MKKKLKYKLGGTGYQQDSPDVNNNSNYIDSNSITMKNVKKKLMLIPIDENGKKGKPVLARPGDQDFYFPNHSSVLEIPMKSGGEPSAAKALEMLHNPPHGKPLTEKQRRYFGYLSNKQDGGMTGMMKSKIATEAHYGNPAAKRMVSPNPNKYTWTGEEKTWNGEQASPAGYTGTHYMGSFGNDARPGLQEVNGKMQYFINPPYDSPENFKFNSPEEAQYFAEHYKEVAPMMRNYKQQGGTYQDSLNLYNQTKDNLKKIKANKNNTEIQINPTSEEDKAYWLKMLKERNANPFPFDRPDGTILPTNEYIAPTKFIEHTASDRPLDNWTTPIYMKPKGTPKTKPYYNYSEAKFQVGGTQDTMIHPSSNDARSYLQNSGYIDNARNILDTEIRNRYKVPTGQDIPANAILQPDEVKSILGKTQYPDYYGKVNAVEDYYKKYNKSIYDKQGQPIPTLSGMNEQGQPITDTAYGQLHRSVNYAKLAPPVSQSQPPIQNTPVNPAIPIKSTYREGGMPPSSYGDHIGFPPFESGGESKSFETSDMFTEKKNDFLNWLKDKSMTAVHKELASDHNQFVQDAENHYHQMPDGSMMPDSMMKDGGDCHECSEEMKRGGSHRPKYNTSKHGNYNFNSNSNYSGDHNLSSLRSYCGGNIDHDCITSAINSPDPKIRKLATKTQMMRGNKFQMAGQVGQQFDPNFNPFDTTPGLTAPLRTSPYENPQYGNPNQSIQNPFPTDPGVTQPIYPNQMTAPIGMQAQMPRQQLQANSTMQVTGANINMGTSSFNQPWKTPTPVPSSGAPAPIMMDPNQTAGMPMTAPTGVPANQAAKTNTTTTTKYGNPAAANLMIAGMDAITNITSQGDIKRREKQLRNMTHADQLFSSTQGSRGDYDTNTGYFRPDQMNYAQNPGASGFRKSGGSTNNYKNGEYYLSDREAQRLMDQGYDVTEIQD